MSPWEKGYVSNHQITKLVLIKKPLLLHVYNKQNLNAMFYNATQSAYKKLVLPSLLP